MSTGRGGRKVSGGLISGSLTTGFVPQHPTEAIVHVSIRESLPHALCRRGHLVLRLCMSYESMPTPHSNLHSFFKNPSQSLTTALVEFFCHFLSRCLKTLDVLTVHTSHLRHFHQVTWASPGFKVYAILFYIVFKLISMLPLLFCASKYRVEVRSHELGDCVVIQRTW